MDRRGTSPRLTDSDIQQAFRSLIRQALLNAKKQSERGQRRTFVGAAFHIVIDVGFESDACES